MCYFLFVFALINSLFGLSYQGNAPKLKVFFFDKNVISGQTVRVYCKILEGSPPLTFRWLKDGQQLKPIASESMGVAIELHEDYSSLVIDRVSAISSGIYTCLVSNIYGSDTCSDTLVVDDSLTVPPLLRSSVLIPILVAVVIIVIACSAAYVYIKIEERNAQLMKAGMLSVSPSKNFQYIDTSSTPQVSARQSVVSEEGILAFRYSDSSDKTKPLLARPGMQTVLWAHETIAEESDEYSATYATLPFQKLSTFSQQPSGGPPPLPPPLPPDNRTFIYDEKGLLCHTPPHTSASNVFCKVDVHHNQDTSDSYDDFMKPQHV